MLDEHPDSVAQMWSEQKVLLYVVNVDWFFLSHRLPIALEALRQGFSVHIATAITSRATELEAYGLIVHPLSLSRDGLGLKNAVRAFNELWKLCRSIRPDLIHLVTIKPVLLGGVVSRLAGVPATVAAISGLGYVFTAQGTKAALRRGIVGLLYRAALGHQKIRLIFQNKDDLAALRKMMPALDSRVSIIRGSGVDLSAYVPKPMPLGDSVVMLAARLLTDKGVLEFVEAARLLKTRGCRARFVLVGTVDSANPTSLTEAQVNSWAKSGVVEYWGQRSDMQVVLSAARLVVLPSYREGLPKVLIEAAACGRAVVTTDVPGCRDAVEAGVTGLLVPVRDAEALAMAIDELLNDPVRCEAMGHAGRALAEQAFDVRKVVQAHMQIYHELIGS